MRLLTNRIVISIFVIVVLAYVWEFYGKPITGPLYTTAVNEYEAGRYQRSLELLHSAYLIDPNDTNILALMGWNHLKLGRPEAAEPHFARAYQLAPEAEDILLGYAYTKLALGKNEEAARLLAVLNLKGAEYADVHIARGTLLRRMGQNREAAEAFQSAVANREADDPTYLLAVKNLREIYDVSGDVSGLELDLPPVERPAALTYPVRVEGDYFAVQIAGAWKPVYWKGVNLTPAMPGHFPSLPGPDPSLYGEWLKQIKELGANAVRANILLPPGFYRALRQINTQWPESPLYLVQGVAFPEPPENDLFDKGYYGACQKEIRDTIDVIHGQGDIAANSLHPGGVYNNPVTAWVAGLVVGNTWPSYVVIENNRRHAGRQSYQGTYLQVPTGSPTEVFLAEMLDYALEYEEEEYNWQHPVAFLNWPTLDPMRHPTESTMLEEVVIRRAQGERVSTPRGPYLNDDEVSLDPTHLRRRDQLLAGYFAAYNTTPFYPDFLNYEPRYQQVRDTEGRNPFFAYVQDLKMNHRGLPLLITEYGIPTSLGISHFSPVGFNEGGLTERQQGETLARFTRNLFDAGVAGGLVFEWLNQWYRHSWLIRNYEVPGSRSVLWSNFMDPSEAFGMVAVDPHLRAIHRLSGDPDEWADKAPLYAEGETQHFQPVGDRYDPARDLQALYVDADEGFFYLRLVVGKLDNDNDGQPDWSQVNYLIGLGTSPERAGLTYLPFIAPVRLSMGMTFAIQLAGPEFSRIWVASSYNPFTINQVPGIPTQTDLGPKLGWEPTLTGTGGFEAQIVEPNRRRFARDGRYFPPQRYERGILRYGSLDPQAPDYDSLASWRANLGTNTIDLRIPWHLINVTDPSSHQVFAGLERDGTVKSIETPGLAVTAFSYRPRDAARLRPIMEQGHTIADAFPGMKGPTAISPEDVKQYRWEGWEKPRYRLRLKESYGP